MNKSMPVILIISLILASCSNIKTATERTPAAKVLSCSASVAEFFKENTDPATKIASLKSQTGLELTADEANDFLKEFNNSNLSVKDYEMLRSILLFSKEDQSIRKDLLKEFKIIFAGKAADEQNKNWEKFILHKKKVDAHKNKLLAKEKTEAGKKAAISKGGIYEKLYYSCKTQIKGKPTPDALRQAKRLTYALTAGSVGSTAITYGAVHWEEEKNSKWFNELYFTLGIGLVFTFVGGKLVLANPNLNPWTGKMPMAFLSNAVSDAGVSGVYAYLFSPKDEVLDKKLKALQEDPEAQEKLQELIKIAEEKNLFEKHLKNSQDFFKDKTTGQPVKLSDFERPITFDDIDIEASRELLLASLAEKEYEDNSGVLSTGYAAVDRFTYHRIFNLFSVPSNIGLTILMNNQMCMTEDPKKGFMKAVALYLAGSIVMDAVYFKTKKDLINQ